MTSLLHTLPRHAALVTAAALVGAGLATTAALTLRARRDLDQALLIAAHAHADPALAVLWETPGATGPVRIRTWNPDALPPELQDLGWETLAEEQPHWRDHGTERVVLLTIEPTGTPDDQDETLHPHRIVVATAPRVGIWGAARPFLLLYTPFAALTSLGAAWAHRRAVRAELRGLSALAGRLRAAGPERLAPLGADLAAADEVRVVAEALDDLLARLGRALEGHRRFAETAAHELRSPLSALLGELQVHPVGNPVVTELALRMASTIEALLALSRLSADELARQRVAMRASELVLEALDRTRVELARAGCRVSVLLVEDPELQVQATLCLTAVENLLRNAARHAPGSVVQVRTLRQDEGVAIEVQDEGPGPGGPSRAGLGLRIVEEVAQHHGARFTLEAGARRGTLARLWFPAPPAPAPTDDGAAPDR